LIRKQKRPICTEEEEEEEEEEEIQEEHEKKMGFEAATSPQSRSSTISGS
jgi:CO dehydrogenase/acetyl-CoA synthase beta subunit